MENVEEKINLFFDSFFLPFSVGLLYFNHSKEQRLSRQPKGQGDGGCSDIILSENPLDHFTIEIPMLSRKKNQNISRLIPAI
jgi:hypothetical protein